MRKIAISISEPIIKCIKRIELLAEGDIHSPVEFKIKASPEPMQISDTVLLKKEASTSTYNAP